MKRILLTIFLITMLAAHGLGNAEQAMEQAQGIELALECGTNAAGEISSRTLDTRSELDNRLPNAPLAPGFNISHQLTALQFSAEAGGMGTSESREVLRNIVCGVKEPGMRIIALTAFLILLLSALYHSILYAALPGVFTFPAGRVAVSYFHAKDGQK